MSAAMTFSWVALVVAFIAGGCFGAFIMALCAVSGRADRRR